MTQVEYEEYINAPVERVYEYYTNPDNIKETWPRDVVKESESTTDSKNEPGSEMKVKGEYMGRKAEMRLEVAEKEPNRRLVTRQTEGPFQRWESIQEFQGDNSRTHIRHTIEYELGTAAKAGNFLTGSQADDKIRQGLQQAAQTVKQKLESR
ncbi:MAG TPA: SRPBCC domain-containing protein [Nitrososphaera sp.]|nr:SRPBCC domain-containing protein [Nitrososphaera sp.]